MPLIDPLELLEREDKWYLGNGGMLVYAPPFPKHLRIPGFWDECHFGDIALDRLLCVSFAAEFAVGATHASPASGVGAALRASPRAGAEHGPGPVELEAHTSHWRWFPDRIEIRHYLVERDGIGFKQQRGVRIFVNETRRIGPDSTLHCELSFEVLPRCAITALHVVGWTAHRRTAECDYSVFSDMAGYGGRLSYTLSSSRRPHRRSKKLTPLTITLWGDPPQQSIEATPAHGAELLPRLGLSPLWDSLKQGRLSGSINGENVLGSTVYAGLHWRLPLANQQIAPLKLYVKVDDDYGAAARADVSAITTGGYHQSITTPDPRQSWREFLSLVPHFECSSDLLTRYYWYRWYGIRLNALPAGGKYSHPAVTEGISYFRGVITYSLMCHLNECRWLSDPALALGCLRNHVTHQAAAGHFAGHIYYSHVNKRGFYHTDIGRALSGLMQHHPEHDYAGEFLRPLRRLLRFYMTERDREGLDLFDVRDQYETGQEFSSRYFHGDDRADLHGWDHKLRLKGVDVTAYVYHLAVLLKELGIRAGQVKLVEECAALIEGTRKAVRETLWDGKRAFFVDYLAKKKERSPYMPATGFWPLLSDLASDEQALAAGLHLLPESAGGTGMFDTPWPTPSVPPDDPYFSADPLWRGERANCPWNGRVWPMVNSHIADVLGRLSTLEPETYRPQLARYIRRYVEMMHFEHPPVARAALPTDSGVGAALRASPRAGAEHGPYPKNPTRPNCFEHYHPYDGTACEYRGIDDYMHSWVNDLLLKYACGIRFEGGKLVVDPLPFKLDWFLLKDCHVAGRRIDVCWNRDIDGSELPGFRVRVDGVATLSAERPQRVELAP